MSKRRLIEVRDGLLPKGWKDALRQLLLFAAAYGLYQLVRGLVHSDIAMASWNATKLINLERTLHVFIEPSIQAWTVNVHWLIDIADVSYLYSQYVASMSSRSPSCCGSTSAATTRSTSCATCSWPRWSSL
jgi:hypothetical protein